jgi:hypothetical protein
MKNLLTILFVLVVLKAHSQGNGFDDFNHTACTNQTLVYHGGWFLPEGYIAYESASYNDGTSLSYSISGDDLIVNWNGHTGAAQVHVHGVVGEGEFWGDWDVTVSNCLSFTSAPGILCTSSGSNHSGTYTLSDTKGSTSYTWTAPSGWSINSGSNTLTTSSSSVTIAAATSGNGSSTISVTGNNSGGRSFNTWLGAPAASISNLTYLQGHDGETSVTVAPSTQYNFGAEFTSGASSFTWYLPSGFSYSGPTHTGSLVRITTSSSPGTYTLNCQATNVCGAGWIHDLDITVSESGGGGGGHQERLAAPEAEAPKSDADELITPNVAYPNPAKGYINVKLSGPSALTLIGSDGRVVHQSNEEGSVSIATHNFASGIYFFTIRNTKEVIRTKVLISNER